MQKPTIDEFEAMRQAGFTMGYYLRQGRDQIDLVFGRGYATSHPELMAACLTAQAADFHTTAIIAVLYSIQEALDSLDKS